MKIIFARGENIREGLKNTKIYAVRTQKVSILVTQFCVTHHVPQIGHNNGENFSEWILEQVHIFWSAFY